MNRTLTYTISEAYNGLRVEQFLKRKGYSVQNLTEIKRMQKSILVNGSRVLCDKENKYIKENGIIYVPETFFADMLNIQAENVDFKYFEGEKYIPLEKTAKELGVNILVDKKFIFASKNDLSNLENSEALYLAKTMYSREIPDFSDITDEDMKSPETITEKLCSKDGTFYEYININGNLYMLQYPIIEGIEAISAMKWTNEPVISDVNENSFTSRSEAVSSSFIFRSAFFVSPP